MSTAGAVMMVVGILVYLAAFAQGPGPTMGDKPFQASLFTLASILLITGFVFLVVV